MAVKNRPSDCKTILNFCFKRLVWKVISLGIHKKKTISQPLITVLGNVDIIVMPVKDTWFILGSDLIIFYCLNWTQLVIQIWGTLKAMPMQQMFSKYVFNSTWLCLIVHICTCTSLTLRLKAPFHIWNVPWTLNSF